MSAKFLLGKEVSGDIKKNLSKKIADLKKKNIIIETRIKTHLI